MYSISTNMLSYFIIILFCLIVSNYEIAQWQFDYLCFWIRETDHPYMVAPIFFDRIHLPYTELLKSFFIPFRINPYMFIIIIDERLTIDNYILFIILFTYSKNHVLLKILLSVCKIQGNVSVNYSQSLSFFSMLNTDALLDQRIFQWLQNKYIAYIFIITYSKSKERILISDLIEFAVSNETLLMQVNMLRKTLVNNVVGKYTYNRVIKRKTFYDDYIASISQQNLPVGLIASTFNDRIPHETCTERTIRELFKKSPPPYYTDFPPAMGISIEAQKGILEQSIVSIRGIFGMNTRMLSGTSKRLSKSSFPKIRPSLMLNSQKSEHNNSFVTKMGVTPAHHSMCSKSGHGNGNELGLFFGEKSKSSKGIPSPSLNGDNMDKTLNNRSKTDKFSVIETHESYNNNILSDPSKVSPDLNKSVNNKIRCSINGSNNNNINNKTSIMQQQFQHPQQQQQQQQHSRTMPQSIVVPTDNNSFITNQLSPHNFGGGINPTLSPHKNSVLKGCKLSTITSVPGQTNDNL